MSPLFEFDEWLVGASQGFETPWLTALMVVLSAWWVKGPVLIGIGFGADVWRKRLPLAGLAAAAATLTTSLLVSPLKEWFDRARPPQAEPGEIHALVALPENASFPSGHAATAFAAATAVAILCPRLRPVALAIAVGVALSRVYLRVHFPLDVLAGAALGAAVGALFAAAAMAVLRRRPATAPHAA